MTKVGRLSDAYRRVWESFLRATATRDGRHDTAYWRAHSGPFAACVVRVDTAELQPGLGVLTEALASVPGVRVHPEHFLHIMLQELGFVIDPPAHPDEISLARLEEFTHAAVEHVAAMSPFAVTFGGTNAFEDAVFLELEGAEPLVGLHARLFELAALRGVPEYPYLPHLTIAHFDGTADPQVTARLLQSWREETFGRSLITEVEMVTLDPRDPYPELQIYAIIPLGT
jgi:2'-5' RNA ligase